MNDRARTIIATSLKMYFDHDETVSWAEEIRLIAENHPAVRSGEIEVIIFPNFTSIPKLVELYEKSPVAVGAQNMAALPYGALTGEVNAPSLRQVGCDFVELGHVERHRYFHETRDDVAQKVSTAVVHNLIPLVCIGEPNPVTEHEAAQWCISDIGKITRSVEAASPERMIFAYEPEWAIGAEKPADASYIRAVTTQIGDWLSTQPSLRNADVIYGGSAGPGLLTELNGAVSGLFLGRFAHDPAAFAQILDEAAAS